MRNIVILFAILFISVVNITPVQAGPEECDEHEWWVEYDRMDRGGYCHSKGSAALLLPPKSESPQSKKSYTPPDNSNSYDYNVIPKSEWRPYVPPRRKPRRETDAERRERIADMLYERKHRSGGHCFINSIW